MTDFKNLFEQAQMAEAAYANFTNASGTAGVISALRVKNFSLSQATKSMGSATVLK